MSTTTPAGVVEQATEYRVSAAPLDHDDGWRFALTVEWRGHDRWAVKNGSDVLGLDGSWDYEMQPSSREDDWLATHRFDLETALRLAREAAPKVSINGGTWAQWQARFAARRVLREEETS